MKRFTLTPPAPHPDGPIEFEMELFRRDDPSADPIIERFECIEGQPASVFMGISAAIRYDERGHRVIDFNAVDTLFQAALSPPDYDRMVRLLHDQSLYISIDDLAAIYRYVIDEYNDRPTQRRLRSINGREPNGASSAAELPSGESTTSV